MNLQNFTLGIMAICLFLFGGCKKDSGNQSGTPEFAITGLHDVTFDSTVSSIALNVDVSQLSGTKEMVRFSIDSLPDSFAAVVTPDSGLAPFNARIVITKAGYVPGGDYPFRITAKSASFSKTYNLNLNVLVAPSDYLVTIDRPVLYYSSFAFMWVTATRISGSGPDPITVSTSGLPPQLGGYTWVQNKTPGQVRTTLLFDESALVPAGTYPFKIHVSSPTYSSTLDMTAVVRAWEGYTVDGTSVRGTLYPTISYGGWGVLSHKQQSNVHDVRVMVEGGPKPTADGVYKYPISTNTTGKPYVDVFYKKIPYDHSGNEPEYTSVPSTQEVTVTIYGGKATVKADNIVVKSASGATKTVSISCREY